MYELSDSNRTAIRRLFQKSRLQNLKSSKLMADEIRNKFRDNINEN
jgi:hypothetical protein